MITQDFDPQKATDEYINSLGPEVLEQAANYTAGNHWLILVGLLVSALVTWLIVKTGWLEKVQNRFPAASKKGDYLTAAVYVVVSFVINLPWQIYSEWWRETSYGRTTQPFADYIMQSGISTVLTAFIMPVFFVLLYMFIRKAGKRWWLYGGVLTGAFMSVMMLLGPVFIEPLFNEYKPLPEGEVRDAIEEIADRVDIAKDRIFVYDGSRQSENFTANVSGIGGSARIAISDVALGEASLEEVLAVTGHEAGHYNSGHIYLFIAVVVVLAMVSFFVVDRFFARVASLFGSRATIDQPAGLPVVFFMIGFVLVLAGPVFNSVVRNSEIQADMYSMETVGLADGMATALVKTAEYRDPLAGPVQEFLFYTHPTVRNRILRVMEWKAAKLKEAEKAGD